MTAVVRHTYVTNTTGNLLKTVPIDVGQEYGTISIEWTFSTADVGTGKGQTADGTDPSQGFLFAQIYGASIKRVFAPYLIKANAAIRTTLWDVYRVATATAATELGFRVDNSVPGVSSLYLLDMGGDSNTKIAVGNKVIVLVEVGNT